MEEAQKKKPIKKENVLDTIEELIRRGTKAHDRNELEKLAESGKQARAAKQEEGVKAKEIRIVPELKATKEAVKEADKLRKALNEAMRHGPEELVWE
jgi:hypothetical protein